MAHPRTSPGESLWLLAVAAFCTGLVAGAAYSLAAWLHANGAGVDPAAWAVWAGLATLLLFGLATA